MANKLYLLAFATLIAAIDSTCSASRPPGREIVQEFLDDLQAANNLKAAQLINADKVNGCKFQKAAVSNTNAVDLIPAHKPTPTGTPHSKCGNDLGIKITGQRSKVFCDLKSISVEINNDERDGEQMRLVLHFQSDLTGSLKLNVPVFEDPLTAVSPLVWNVILKSEDLYSIAEGQQATFDLDWLERLVSQGLFPSRSASRSSASSSSSASNYYSALTYPILLRSDAIQALIHLCQNC